MVSSTFDPVFTVIDKIRKQWIQKCIRFTLVKPLKAEASEEKPLPWEEGFGEVKQGFAGETSSFRSSSEL